jgi:ABC-type branched-subunit amino acid transport system substrate-binding protein
VAGLATAASVTLAAGVGCSLLVNHESTQCVTNADCARAPFANQSICTEGVCVAPAADGGGNPIPDSSLFADVPTPPCQTNQDCLPLHGGANWICRKSDGACVEVDSPDCPSIIGNYTSDDVILLGALLPLPSDQVYGKMGAGISDALRLAVGDFSGNLPAVMDGGNTRPLAVVLCSETVNADRAARHLRDDLHVPLVFGTAFSASTLTVAQDVTLQGEQFLFSPAAGSDLSPVNDGGLVWRTIPSDSYQAAAIDATVSFLEASSFPAPDGGAPDGGAPLRVAIVHQADVYGNQLAADVASNLTVNGGPAGDAGANFADIDYGNPDQPTTNQNQLYADAINAVEQQHPNIVVLLGYTHAIGSVLSGIESEWPPGKPPPLYVLSNGLNTADLLTAVGTNDGLRKRILLTSPGQSASNSVTSSFYIRYRTQFTSDGTYPQSYAAPNMYDAFYAAAYALAATRNTDLNGLDVLAAMRKVLGVPDSGTATSVNVGSDAISTAFAAIQEGTPITLHGVSGPLNFDLATGDVVSDVQIWCLAAGTTTPTLQASGLSYSASLSQLQGDALDPSCN